MPIIFDILICDDEECGGYLNLDGICEECGRVVDPIEEEEED